MFRTKALVCSSLLPFGGTHCAGRFSGTSALQFTRAAVAFGPRPIDSPAHRKLQGYIFGKLRAFGAPVEQDIFTAQTPIGLKRINNIIAKAKGQGGQARRNHWPLRHENHGRPGVCWRERRRFVDRLSSGDGAPFCGKPRKNDLYLVWLDGEEAVQNWTESDSLYGSRHLAKRWKRTERWRDKGHHQCRHDRRRRFEHHARMELDSVAAEYGVGGRRPSDMQRIFQRWTARWKMTIFHSSGQAQPRST